MGNICYPDSWVCDRVAVEIMIPNVFFLRAWPSLSELTHIFSVLFEDSSVVLMAKLFHFVSFHRKSPQVGKKK